MNHEQQLINHALKRCESIIQADDVYTNSSIHTVWMETPTDCVVCASDLSVKIHKQGDRISIPVDGVVIIGQLKTKSQQIHYPRNIHVQIDNTCEVVVDAPELTCVSERSPVMPVVEVVCE